MQSAPPSAAVLSPPSLPGGSGLAVLDDPLELARFTRRAPPAGSGEVGLAESSLQLSGLHCAACADTIADALRRVDGVAGVEVSAAAQRATVRWDPSRARASALVAAVRLAGYDAVPDHAAAARELRRREARQALWRLFVAGFCGMQVMMFATPAYVAGPGELSPDLRQLLAWGGWLLSLPVMAFSAWPFFAGAGRAARARRIGMDVPVALGLLITFVASTGATFDPQGPFGHEVWFDSLAMFVAFLLGARFLEMRARHAAAEALEASLARMPETAWRVPAGTAPGADVAAEPVSPLRLAAGDRVRVPLGEAFPADGLVLDGPTQADESLLTGESTPVAKPAGSTVVAGSINLDRPVTVQVERAGADTRLEALAAMMRGALAQRPAAAALADRWAGPFLWAVLALAAGAAAAWSYVDPSKALWVAVSVLIVTCPCALSLAAPAVLVAAARAMARDGVRLQRLDAVERLARADRLFIDKTGTLTRGRPAWRATVVLTAAREAGADSAALLRTAAALARRSRHPLSQALARAPGTGEATAGAHDWTAVREQPGRGLEACDGQGRTWRLGSEAWVGATPDDRRTAPAAALWLGQGGRAWAAFEVDDPLRDGAGEAVRALRDSGLRVTLLSGDTAQRVADVAASLGLGDDAVAGATPEDKLAAVAQAQQRGEHVAMVGDGINDAPVLARADVSLAMGQGALLARSQADAVVTSGRLADIVAARRRARIAMRLVRQNLAWAAGYNALCIPLALAGGLPPWAAGLGMAGSSLFVTLNALRAAR
jgi:Cu2+-exporting ATPase